MGGVYVVGETTGNLGGPNAGNWDIWVAHYDGLATTRYCAPATQNSTGEPGVLTATGSNTVVANNFTLSASQLPKRAFGFFLTSMMQGLTVTPGGSQGILCLGGGIGSFLGTGQVLNTGASGSFTLALNLNAWPTLLAAVQPGDTWNVQCWYRDANPSGTSNFTDAVTVTFQ